MASRVKFIAGAIAVVLVVTAQFPGAAWGKQGEFTAAKYEASISGTSISEKTNALTVAGYTVECNESGLGGNLAAASTTLTLTPSYNGCHTEGFEFSNVTITENGCGYKIKVGEGSFDKWPSTVSVECPTGKKFVVHIFFDQAHEIELCTVEIPAQEGVAGPTFKNLTGAGKLEIEGKFEGLKYSQAGAVCEIKEPTNGVRDLGVLLEGRHEGEVDKLLID